MAASTNLFLGEDQQLPDETAVGFFGDDFGNSIGIGQFNNRTFVTDSSGILLGFEANNNRKISESGVVHGQAGVGIDILQLPNRLATVNIRFENDVAVRTLAAKLYIFDGSFTGEDPNFTIAPLGLTTFCAEIRHEEDEQTSTGLGDPVWEEIAGSTFLPMVSSPGTSGLRPFGSFTVDTRHDWYAAISCSPTSLGDKVFGLYFETEFL